MPRPVFSGLPTSFKACRPEAHLTEPLSTIRAPNAPTYSARRGGLDAVTLINGLHPGRSPIEDQTGSRARLGQTEKHQRLRPRPSGRSCGVAVFRNETQFVPNTFSDPRWLDLHQLACDFNLRSSWAVPMIVPGSHAIGSFALSNPEHRSPGAFHRKILEIGASIIRAVLEPDKSQELKKLFGESFAAINQGVMGQRLSLLTQ